MELKPKKFDLSEINGGIEYIDEVDTVSAEVINKVVQSGAYVQALTENTPDTSMANNVGTPKVLIEETENGTPKFVFINLKGEQGTQGKDGENGKTPEKGVDYFTESDKNEIADLVLSKLPQAEGESF